MKVEDLVQFPEFCEVTLPDSEREIEGVYIGDLLSWVMGKAESGDAWITIMSNINTVAVATLTDTACILLAEGVKPEEEVIKTAEQKGINIISTTLTAFETAKFLAERL